MLFGVIGVGVLGIVHARAAGKHSPGAGQALRRGAVTPIKPPPGSAPVGIPGLEGGACIAFAPSGPDLHRTVFVDPGHGGPDPGAVSGGAKEKDLTLAVALELREQLTRAGYRVVLARAADTSVVHLLEAQVQSGAITESGVHADTAARIACANAAGADVLLSIHFNAFDDPSVGGAETFFDDAREFAVANGRLAALVQGELMDSYRRFGWTVPDRGVISDAATGSAGLTAAGDDYGRLMELGPFRAGWNDSPSQMPGALVEPFFITDPVERGVALSSEGRMAIASGLAAGVDRFLAAPG